MRAAAALGVILAAACGNAGPGEAPHIDELPELAWTVETRIGSLDDPDAGFSRIGAIRVAPNGDVYVVDGPSREIRVFNPAGERVRTLGGQGGGPGEFQMLSDMGFLGDTLWVTDPSARRITFFGPDDAVVHTTPALGFPIESGQEGLSLSVVPSRPRPDGTIESGLVRMISQRPRIEPYSYPVVRFDRDGEVVDTLRRDTNDENAITFRVGDTEGYAPGLLPRRPLEQDAGDGRVVLDWTVPAGSAEGVLDIVRLGPAGDTIDQRVVRYAAIPVPASVLDSLMETQLILAPMLGVSEGEMERALRGAIELPEHRPPVRAVHVGSEGSIWIQLNGTSADAVDWLVIGGDGAPLGTVRLPPGMRIRHSDLPTVWAVEQDEFDVPWLLRLRVEPGA